MRINLETMKKVLAFDQISEGLEFDKRPSNQELIFSHILLTHFEQRKTKPRDLTELVGCSSESLRIMLRRAEKGGFLSSAGRPNYEIIPCDKYLNLISTVGNQWLDLHRDRLASFTTTLREVFVITQAFDIYARAKNLHAFMFRAPVRRGIVFYVLEQSETAYVELKRIKNNFPIDHESLRQFVKMMFEAGYFQRKREGNRVFVRASDMLANILEASVEDVCDRLNVFAGSTTIYSDFIDALDVAKPTPQLATISA